ncbi:hypothetical protein LMG29542_07775 [Paraburkholderia humisilvae]|uniref:Uncharacterized protein n=1 Tax=Paraburkholderia humisilvae TaxID=627669 RepID=A0A6J5F7P6_9BURK|nr:hypothetical protein LMG29542_07775 [Paraburkholderia humisilvae]
MATDFTGSSSRRASTAWCARAVADPEEARRARQDRLTRCGAVKLVRSLRAGDLSAVYVPSVEDEAFRDLARAWVRAKDDLKRARQQLKAFLLAHGVRYTGRADWGPAHRRWISQYSFDSAWQQLAFEECRRTIEDRLARCTRLEAALRKAVVGWRFYSAVPGLQTMRGCSSRRPWACSLNWVTCHASCIRGN